MGLLDNVGGSDDVDTPTARAGSANERRPRERVAVWFPEDEEPSQFPEDWERIPPAVAKELGLASGDKLVVEQRPVMHVEDQQLAKRAGNRDGTVDLLRLTQAVIDETVTDSNFGIPETPIVPEQEGDEYLAAPELSYFLVNWLGATDILQRMRHSMGADIQDFRRGSGGS